MNTRDRELLELAAKATGLLVEYRGFGAGEAVLSRLVYDNKHNGITAYKPWNPLEDDGDAFRLAVNLDLIGSFRLSHFIWAESENINKLSATRRAIVRAAAEIGKEM